MVKVDIEMDTSKLNADKWIEAYDKYGEDLLREGADYLLESAIFFIEFYNAIDTGELMNSGHVRKTENGYEVVFDAPHAIYVHNGRDPSSKIPPLQEIVNWVRRKKINVKDTPVSWSFMQWLDKRGLVELPLRYIVKKKKGAPTGEVEIKHGKPTNKHKLYARAFYISKRIAKMGIKGKPFLDEAIYDLKYNVDKVIDRTQSSMLKQAMRSYSK